MQQYLEAGKVVTTHGVRGEMKLELWCDGVDFLKKVGKLYPSVQGGKSYKIVSIRPQGQMALLQLEGVNDMDAARALRGQVFYFDRNDATLPAGRWYVADLIGCEVRDADTGKVYGVVTSVDHPGAQDIYTVKSPSGKEYMFPGVDAFLKERNPPEGYILVTRQGVRRGDQRGSPRRTGYLYGQIAQRQGIYVPRRGCLSEGTQSAGGVYPCYSHPGAAGRRF